MGRRLTKPFKFIISTAVVLGVWGIPAMARASNSPSPQLTEQYKAEFVSQNPYPRLMAGQSYEFRILLKNIGSMAWDPSIVHLGTDRGRDRIPGFIREDIVGNSPSGWISENRVAMLFAGAFPAGDLDLDGLIDPGEQATFSFWYSIPQTMDDGVYKEYFRLVADGITWLNSLGIYWDITVDNRPHAKYIDQSPYPAILKAGDSFEYWVRFQNTWLIPWRDDGPTPVYLGTDRLQDRIPGFHRHGPAGTGSGWFKENRVHLERDPLTLKLVGDVNDNNQIDQGEIARFRFWYTVPETMESGAYAEYFRPVMDNRGNGWMEDYGVFWTNVVDNIAPRPTNIVLTSKVNEFTIVWAASAEAVSYKVRYRAVGGDVFAVLDVPGSLTSATINVAGGQAYEVGVASVDAEGVSPFSSQVLHVESPAEAQARIAAAAARQARQERIAEEQRQAEEAQEEPVVTGPPGVEGEETRDWRQFWLTLLIILGAAGLATAGYYGYEWWAESRRAPRPVRSEPPKRELPKREEPPKPPSTTTRW